MAYVANGQLYLRSIDRDETIPLRGSQFARSPFFSGDGKWIGFFQNGWLQKLAVGGGSPIMLCEWDTVLSVETEPELSVGVSKQLFDGPYLVDGTGHASYDISPDGDWFLMIAQGGANRLEVVLNWTEELKRLVPME